MIFFIYMTTIDTVLATVTAATIAIILMIMSITVLVIPRSFIHLLKLKLKPGWVGVGGTRPNFDGGVPLVNAKTHPSLRETKGPDKPQV